MLGDVIEIGQCVCHSEPWGRHGLEGYDYGEEYKFELREGKKGRYMRVYHDPEYYETCGPKVFDKFFRRLTTPLISEISVP